MHFNNFNRFFSDPMTGMLITTNNEDTSLLPLPSSNPVIQNGIANFDFTQFWELVKPLLIYTVHNGKVTGQLVDFNTF
jgi:hypothetical protein